MKTRFIILLWFVFSQSIQAQSNDHDVLEWLKFEVELGNIVKVLTENESVENVANYKTFDREKFMDLLLNTSIEQRGMDRVAQRYGKDSLVLVRQFALSVFREIAEKSRNSSNRSKAINYLLDYSLNPGLTLFFLNDFDEEVKQKIAKILREPCPEDKINFVAMSQQNYDMIKNKKHYENRIQAYIKEQNQKYKKKVSYKEARDTIYQRNLQKKKDELCDSRHYQKQNQDLLYLHRMIINAGLLNIKEAIPYLKDYTDSDKYNEETKKYAICALATMRVDDYEDKAVVYFETDEDNDDNWLAKIINSQKVWYAYMNRIKSEKYNDGCPVAYRTIQGLYLSLKDFPKYDRPWYKEVIEDGIKFIAPAIEEPIPLVPEGCGRYEKTPINPDHIKIVVDWMEANKGKYELQRKVDRTF